LHRTDLNKLFFSFFLILEKTLRPIMEEQQEKTKPNKVTSKKNNPPLGEMKIYD
jgi:hypothetical protein